MKTKVVVFTSNNARILVNPADLDYWRSREDALIDPDLSAVKAIPPHYWKRGEGGAVLPMDAEERKARDADIAAKGADCAVLPVETLVEPEPPAPAPVAQDRRSLVWLAYAASYLLAFGVGLLIGQWAW